MKPIHSYSHSFSKNQSSPHKSKGDYYAVSSTGYIKFQNVQVQSPNPLATLQPYSKCHYLLPMNKHQEQDDKSDIKSIKVEDGKSTFFSSNKIISPLANKSDLKAQDSFRKYQSEQKSKLPNNHQNMFMNEKSQREEKRYVLKKMSLSNVIQSNTPSPKKGILKRSYHEFDQSNSTLKKQSIMIQLERQREKSKKLQESYKRLMKLANDRGLQSQQIQDQQKDSMDKYTSHLNSRYNMLSSQPYQSARSQKKVHIKNLTYHQQNTQDCQQEEYDDITEDLTLPHMAQNIRKSKMLQKSRLIKNKDSSQISTSSFEGINNNYSKSIATKCPTVISSSRDNYQYQDKLSIDMEIILNKLNNLQYEMNRRQQEAIKQRQQRDIREKQRQIQALEIQNARIKNLNQMILMANKKREQEQAQARKQRQRQKQRDAQKQLAASQSSSLSTKASLFQMNGNGISILLMTILVMIMTSKNIMCNQ